MAMKVGKLWVNYDDTTDVLYLSVGEPKPARTHEDEEDDSLLIRRDSATGEAIGVTVLEYYGHFRQMPDLSWLARLDLPSDLIDYLQRRPLV